MNKIKIYFHKLNAFFNQKENILLFLLLFIGVAVPTFSGSDNLNFYYRLYNIFTSPIFHTMCFLAYGINIIYMKKDFSENYNNILRHKSYSELIRANIKDIAIFSCYLTSISLILGIAGSLIFCFGNLETIVYNLYQVPLALYLIFIIIRMFIFNILIQEITYLISLKLKKIGFTIWILLQSGFFFLLPSITIVNHFYNMPILPYYYYLNVPYSSLWLEIICTLLSICLLLFIYKFLFYVITKRKKDI